ncbi:ketopantoate reductase PanE/ApbA-domain-containing protein [Lasiosphaeria ovina]|uniref:Ketopantoate reductase PanE/ApbA-domain-containing protein n=1 Tax=Lasiosphaeria ovina TaxID=92902 RepID=A0AAE0TYY4_9PEZI|nr:ketopantoate reductase PanE/ApbA-domain-containing protein [Lasiosphaeria ovina]
MSLHQAPEPGSDPDSPVHVVFVGAGAVGCFYASRLHHPSHNVYTSLIARSNYKALEANGVKLQTHTFGDYTFVPDAVFPSVAAAAVAQPRGSSSTRLDTASSSSPPPSPLLGARDWDFVVVTTKALPDRSDDSELIAPLVGPRTCVVLIQNGVGVEAPYRARFPRTPIVSAVTVVSAEQTSPGTVRQNRWTRIHLGPYSNSASFSSSPSVAGGDGGGNTTAGLTPAGSSHPTASGAAAEAAAGDEDEHLQKRGMACAQRLGDWWTRLGGIRDVELSDEIGLQTVRWHKLCINAAFNPSAVLSGGRGNADMARDPELRAHLAGVMGEIWAAAPRILGRPFPADLAGPDKILKSTERNVGSKPSMLLDWEAARSLELEVILGNPVRIARGKGVDLPRMQTLYALLRSAQRVREERARENKL